MKALLVVEDKQVLNELKQILNEQGFDTICYQWIIKALDNVEEISPHIVIISAKDYPRHWKTLVQYIQSNLIETEPAIILISNELSKDESDKVAFLKIKTLINDVEQDKQQLIEALNELKPNEAKPILNEKVEYIKPTPLENLAKWDSDTNIVQAVTEEKPITQATKNKIIKSETIKPKTEPTKKQSTFTITHPVTHEEIFGKVESFKYPNLNFIPDDEKMFSVLRFGQVFNGCILKEFDENGTEQVSTHRAQIRGNADNIIRFCLLK